MEDAGDNQNTTAGDSESGPFANDRSSTPHQADVGHAGQDGHRLNPPNVDDEDFVVVAAETPEEASQIIGTIVTMEDGRGAALGGLPPTMWERLMVRLSFPVDLEMPIMFFPDSSELPSEE
ncbi:hypothetical protein MRX96_036131 [Rhipicephalus microplus]